jgi:tRNA(Ile)-lysidine synthase
MPDDSKDADLFEPFCDFIASHRLIAASDRILVAVSGGKDSVALLDLLHRFASSSADRLGVVYIDHGWDPKRHESEQAFVRELANRYSITFHFEKIESSGGTKPGSMSLEAWSRQERYRLLNSVLCDGEYDLCALGHTADDQAETVLMRILKGSGLWGLSGIPVRRDAFVRPLMAFSSTAIIRYLALRKLQFLEDPTNRDRRFLRSRIRYNLLPKLEHYFNPEVKEALIGLSQDISQWRNEVNRVFPSPIRQEKGKIMLAQSTFFLYLDILKKIWLQEALLRATGVLYTLRRHHIHDVSRLSGDDKTGKWIRLPGGMRLLRDRDRLILIPELPSEPRSIAVSLGDNNCRSLGVTFSAELMPANTAEFSDNRYIEWMDFDRIAFPWILRHWKPGDRFHPLGAPGYRKISDFLIDQKVPRFEKDRTLVLEASGEIVWVVGHRLSQSARITKGTGKVVRCEVADTDSNATNDVFQSKYECSDQNQGE